MILSWSRRQLSIVAADRSSLCFYGTIVHCKRGLQQRSSARRTRTFTFICRASNCICGKRSARCKIAWHPHNRRHEYCGACRSLIRGTRKPTCLAASNTFLVTSEDVDCSRTRSRVGPFHFAKGPLFFVSTPLVRQLRRSNDARSLAEAAIATANRSHDESLLPWEDVLNGLALAVSSTTRGNNNAIHAIHVGETPFGSGVFIEPHSSRVPGDYLALAPSTLLLHEKYKHHNRIGIAHRWLGRHHCAPKRIELSCLPHTYLSCAGGKWARCYTTDAPYVEAGCSTNLTKLSGGFSADANEPSATLPSSESCKQRMQPQGWGRWKLPQSSSEPPSTKLQGTCAETEFGEGDCEGGMSGAWVVRGALGDCLKLCECCARCRFASFSKANSDCSWFAECNTSSLLRSGPARGYQTVEMPRRGHVK